MAAVWYAKIGERQYGPLAFDQLKRLASAGKLSRKSHVRQGEQGAWTAAASIAGLFDASPPPGGAAPPPARKPSAAAPSPPRVAGARPAPAAPRRAAPPKAAPAAARASDSSTVTITIPVAQAYKPTVAMASADSTVMQRTGESKASGRHGRRKKQASPVLVFGGIAGVVVVLGVLVGVMYYTFTRNHEEPAKVAKADAKKLTDVPADASVVAAVAGKADAKKPAEAAEAKASADGKAKPAARAVAKAADETNALASATDVAVVNVPALSAGTDDRLARVQGIRAWADASSGGPWGTTLVHVQLVNQWRADAPADVVKEPAPQSAPATPAAAAPAPAPAAAPEKPVEKPVNTIDPAIAALLDQASAADAASRAAAETKKKGAAAPPAPKPEAPPAAAKTAGKYLYLELVIKNVSPRSQINYAGWNNEKKTAAILAYNGTKLCELVPISALPASNRQPASVLVPGDELTEVLVFEAPSDAGELESLHLLLPFLAFGRKGDDLALSIPATMVIEGAPKAVAAEKPAKKKPSKKVAQAEAEDEGLAETITLMPNEGIPGDQPKKGFSKEEQAQEAEKAELDRLIRGEPDPEMKKKPAAKEEMEDDNAPPAKPGLNGNGFKGAQAMAPPPDRDAAFNGLPDVGPPPGMKGPPPGPGMAPPPAPAKKPAAKAKPK